MTKERTRKILTNIVAILFGCTAAFIVVINLLKSKFTGVLLYFHKLETLLPHPVLMLIGVVFIVGLYLLLRKVGDRQRRALSERTTLLITGGVFFVLQMFFIYNYCFESGWDVQMVLGAAREIAHGNRVVETGWYFSMYPNNLFITQIFAFILWITIPLHLGALDYLAIVAVQSMLCVLTAWMLYQIIVGQTKKRWLAWFGLALYLLLVGISPWTSIPYSDAWALFFPTAVLWTVTTSSFKEKPFLRWFIAAVLAYIGYKIKPQTIFVFVSAVCVDIISLLLEKERKPLDKSFWRGSPLGACVGLVSAFVFALIITATAPIRHNSDSRFGIPHYLMMGVNHISLGGYCDDDVIFSHQYKTPRERNKANLQETTRRLRWMGPSGFGYLACEKTLINHFDGTFNWGKEGEFLKIVYPERNGHLSPFLRNLYYNLTIHGKYYPYWCTGATAIWLGVLFLMLFAAFGKLDRFSIILMLSILCMTLFETIFEARSRYLYGYVPLYILLALQGIGKVEYLFRRKKEKLPPTVTNINH